MDYIEFGKRVRILRKRMKLTQEELAELVDVSHSFIGHIERGTRKLSVDTLFRLCAVLKTSADELIGLKK